MWTPKGTSTYDLLRLRHPRATWESAGRLMRRALDNVSKGPAEVVADRAMWSYPPPPVQAAPEFFN